jgi:hypothetical protein
VLAKLPAFLEEVPLMVVSSFQPGPVDTTGFRADSNRCFAPFEPVCGDGDALKGGKDASNKGGFATFLMGVAMMVRYPVT